MNKKRVSDIDSTRVDKMLMKLFGDWQISTAEQLSLLGLTQYRNGQPFSSDRDRLERSGVLLGIHKSLRLLFPHNRDLAYGWMTQPNRALKGATPVQVIDEQGMAGLYMVRAYLDVQLRIEPLVRKRGTLKLPFSEAELLRNLTPESAHADEF